MANATPPPRLYRYRDTSRFTKSIFANRELFFANPADFNDPFDCAFRIICQGERNREVIESQAIKTVRRAHPDWSYRQATQAAIEVSAAIVRDHPEEASRQFGTSLARDYNDKAGILCLSATPTNTLLWSHYADGHKGICLEFRTDVKRSIFAKAQSITYSEEYPHLDLHTLVKDERFRNATAWMLTKSLDWSYEQEWRILDFKKSRGVRTFPPKCLSAVILGNRISDRDRKKVLGWVRHFPTSVKVLEAKASNTHFRMEIEEIACDTA